MERASRHRGSRSSEGGCSLCALGASSPVALHLWNAHALGGQARERVLRELLDDAGISCELADVARHMHYHHVVQPEPPLRWARAHARFLAERLTDRDRAVLRFVSRVGRVTVEQVADAFFPHRSSASAQTGARRALLRLIYNHALYRVWLPTRVGDARQFYGLGKVGYVLLGRELEGGHRRYEVRYYTPATELRTGLMPHDFGALSALTGLMEVCRRQPRRQLMGREVSASIPARNVWAARYLLGFGYEVPKMADDGKVQEAQRVNLYTDAFLTVGVATATQSFALPLMVEWDTGSKALPSVADQLWSYIPLSLSRAAAARFPTLSVPGYDVPLLFITDNYYSPNSAGRAQAVLAELLALHARRRFVSPAHMGAVAPVYIAARGDWEAHNLQAPVRCFHRGGATEPLLQALYRDTLPLLRQAPVSADEPLAFVATGARPHNVEERAQRTRRAEQEDQLRRAQADTILDRLAAGPLAPPSLPTGGAR